METLRTNPTLRLPRPGVASPPRILSVSAGVFRELVPAGRSVGELRQALAQALDLDDNARAVVGGREVDDQYVPSADEQLVFTRRSGEKGCRPWIG